MEYFIMNETSLQTPRLPFSIQAQLRVDNGIQDTHQGRVLTPPRFAVHGNETYIPRGTSLADLTALFPK